MTGKIQIVDHIDGSKEFQLRINVNMDAEQFLQRDASFPDLLYHAMKHAFDRAWDEALTTVVRMVRPQ